MADKKIKSDVKEILDDFKIFPDVAKHVNESIEQMARHLQDVRDFTKSVVFEWGKFEDPARLNKSLSFTKNSLAGMAKLMESFQSQSIGSRFAIEELNNGIDKSGERMDYLNGQVSKFAATQRVVAKDDQLRVKVLRELEAGIATSSEHILSAKEALVAVDATILEQKRKEWGIENATFAQIQKRAQQEAHYYQQEQYRLDILAERKKLIQQIEDTESKGAKMKRAVKGAAAKGKVTKGINAEIAGFEKILDNLEEKYIASGGNAKDGFKDLTRQMVGVQRERDKIYNDQLVAQILLGEAEQKNSEENIVDTRRRAGFGKRLLDTNYESLGILGDTIVKTKKWYEVAKLIPNEFILLETLLKLGIERFQQLDKAAEDFRKETGFSNTQMVDLRKNAEAINVEFAGMGVSINVAYKSAKALTDVFGRTSLVSKEALQNVSLMSANLGVVEENSAAVLATFQGLGGASEQAAMNVIKVGAGISDKAGIPFKLVMQDVASASEDTLSMLGANPSKLMKSAIAARSMGLELNKLVSSQRKILDFSNSITDEMEASALLGKNVNFQLARQLAFEGRVEDSARATLETVKNAGDFNKMNVYQREALAKAAGMELKDLTKMMAVEAQRDAILKGNDESKKATLKAQEKELAALKKINDLDSADLVKQNEKALMQQKIQGLITKLKNSLESMVVAIGNILEPIITPLVTIVVPVFSLIAWTVGLIAKGLAWILSPIKWIADGVASIADGTGSWSKTVGFVKEQFKDLGTTVGTLIQIAGAGLIAAIFFGSGGVGAVMGMIAKPFKAVGSFAKSLVEKVKGPSATTGTPDISKGVEKTEKSSRSMKSNNGSGIKSFLTNLAAGLKKMAGAEVFKGALNLIPASIGLVVMIPGVLGAKLLSMVDGEKLSSALEGMAKGLKKMAGVDVLLGALNLIPASIGLVLMIPGVVGAKLLSMIDGDAVKEALGGIASGLKKMAGVDVLLGAGALMLTSLALAVMIPGLIGMAGIALLGAPFSAGLIAMGVGLSALGGNPMAWLGIAAVAALSLAFVGFAFGIKLIAEGLSTVVNSFSVFGDLDWSTIAKGFVTMLGLGYVAAVLGLALPFIIMGAISLGVLSVAMMTFGAAMEIASPGFDAFDTVVEKLQMFGEVDWSSVAMGVATVVGAAASFAIIGFFAAAILAGAAAIAFMSLGITAFGKSIEIAAPGLEILFNTLDKIGQIGGDGLLKTAFGITALAGALAAFGAGSAVAGIGNFIGGFLGGDPIDKLKELSSMGSQLQITADSIQKISNSMSNFGAVDAFTLSVDKLTLSLSKLNSQMESMSVIKLAALSVISAAAPAAASTAAPTAEAAPTDVGGIGGKLDELISLMRSGGIAVNLDGRKVSSAMASSGRD